MAEEKTNQKPAPLAEVVLPDSGKKAAVLRKLKGRELRLAGRSAPQGDQIGLVFHMIAQVVTLDGVGITGEDLDDLALEDVNAIMAAVPGLGKSLASVTGTS